MGKNTEEKEIGEKKIVEDGRKEEEIAEDKKKKIALNQPQFTQVCKAGFLTAQEKNGRIDITFSSNDILTLCKGNFLEKQVFDETYKFGLINIDLYEINEIVKRSPMFGGIVDLI